MKYIIDYKELIKEWDFDKNTIKPIEIEAYSKQEVWWKCEKGHSYLARVENRVKGNKCPYCAGQRVLAGYNDLLSQYPEIAKEWNYEKNEIKPTEIAAKSGKKVWWKCSRGHEWQAIVGQRTKNGKRGCPYCSNRLLLKGFNDLATTNPELLKEWDYERNVIKPDEIIAGETKKYGGNVREDMNGRLQL